MPENDYRSGEREVSLRNTSVWSWQPPHNKQPAYQYCLRNTVAASIRLVPDLPPDPHSYYSAFPQPGIVPS